MSRKTIPDPAAATRRPPRAGPTARETLTATPARVTAAESSRRGTSSGMIACKAGPFIAEPSPRMKVSKSSNQGVTIPASVSTPSTAAETSIQLCVTSKSRRRSTTSARAPAGSASKTTGRLPAVSTSATSMGDVVRETMSQDSPTSSIHVPILDTTVAIHSARKIGSARGLHGEVTVAESPSR